jgi:predicted O-linked N-acetylglucosamine transferase (SPINDLY family)/GT2 family glycosyltransferase
MSISLREFELQILNTIEEGNLNFALNSIISLADEIAYGPNSAMTLVNVFGSIDLDRLCQHVGLQTLITKKYLLESKSLIDNQLIIYVASQLYNSGGHTGVIEDLITARPEKNHLILITDTFNLTDRAAVENRFRTLNVQILWGPVGESLDKLNWLQDALSVNQAERVFLFNHPHDAVAVAAVQPQLTPNLIFYHHSSHLFTLGIYIPCVQHIDFDPASFYNCRNNLGISNNNYLPLTIKSIPDLHLAYSPSLDKLTTCASGSENKFKGTTYLYSYIDEIPKIIAASGGNHIHIGHLSPVTLNDIEKNLQQFGINVNRFIYIPWVQSIMMAMHEYKVDIYLDSFPLGGGRAVVEVMASGIPIIVHNNYRSRQLCTTDITYPEAFRWQKPDELYQYLSTVESEKLRVESIYARKYYEINYLPETLKKTLIKVEQGEAILPPPELKQYIRDDLQSFFDRFSTIINDRNKATTNNRLQYPNSISPNFHPEYKIEHAKENKKNLSLPLVSVCIPTYNGEQFLEETLNTVLNQTYPNLEIIISDDNSNDRTIEIAKSFKDKFNCSLSILEHEQYGLSQNWNFCVSQAQGKYIKFLFQDDLLEPDAIFAMVELAEHDDEVGLVFSPRRLFVSSGDTYYDPSFLENHGAKDIHKGWSKLKPIQLGRDLLSDRNLFNYSINKIGEPTTVLIKKEMFNRVGLFNSDLCQIVDLEMWLRIISECKVGFVNKYLSHFRLHEHQQTNRNSSKEGVILSDLTSFFCIMYNDKRYPDAARINAVYAYYVYIYMCEENSRIDHARAKIVEEWLICPEDRVEDAYEGLLGKAHVISLLFSSLKPTIITEEEQNLLSEVDLNIIRGYEQPRTDKQLLIAMLYRRADQLSLPYDLSHIPDWLLPEYLKFIFAMPVNFSSVGEADSYRKYFQGWVNYLHTSIFNNLDDRFWQDIAHKFVQITSSVNSIAAYFNKEDLKNLYVQRAEIIELSLKNSGCQIDYSFGDRPVNRNKVRLGIVASDFNPSAETFAALPIYEYLSREFEVILYSFQQTHHPLEQYCRSAANYFITLPESLTEQVDVIRRDDLDILFFATNVTAFTNRICLLASHRLARIQITSGGSVVTTGMRNMDYFISGTFTDPAVTAQAQYREELIQLSGAAHCFSYGDYVEESSTEIDRAQLGIAEEAVVFTSGANFYKIIPELIHTWAKILAGVPNSVIMLFPFGPNWSSNYPKQAFETHLHQIFAEYGVSADRILALDPQPVPNREDIKEYFKLADIYLDSYPFAGTTSLIEPLQVNLPVIARQGNSFRSAMGSAMIRSLEIADLVADSEESYIQLAVNLGNNSELRHQKRTEVQSKMQANPSFLDSRGYATKIDKLFKKLLDRYTVDKLTKSLCLRDVNLMIFPDWSQSEASVGLELQQVIQTLATHSESQNTTLLIDTTNINFEDAQIFISSIAMNLMMEEDIDIIEELEISLIEDLSNIQWASLLPKIEARIVLECDNQEAVAKLPHQNFARRQLESFILN